MSKDYAIVLTCNKGYGFGMMASMNAQAHFKTNADWEIGYDDYTEKERQKISESFPFKVNWTPISDLIKDVVDKRTDQRCPLNSYWIGYWLLASKLLKEKKYKAVCVIQADQFVFVNLDDLFEQAAHGKFISSEYGFSGVGAGNLPYGDDKAIWDRSQCGLFDSINFISQQHLTVAEDIVRLQAEDAFRGEANHSVIALNRSVCKHLIQDDVIGLPADVWTNDHRWHYGKWRIENEDIIYDEKNVQVKSWHARWWQIGRASGEWRTNEILERWHAKDTEYFKKLDIQEHNYNLVKTFMERFNNMRPEIKSEIYEKNRIEWPKIAKELYEITK